MSMWQQQRANISRRHGSLLLCQEHFFEYVRTGDSGIISYMSFSHANASWLTYEGVMSHVWMSRVTHMNESCHTCEWVMSHMWRSHVSHVNASCHTCEWVMSHMWVSHVSHMNESCPTYEYVMSHARIRHVSHKNRPCHIAILGHVTLHLLKHERSGNTDILTHLDVSHTNEWLNFFYNI